MEHNYIWRNLKEDHLRNIPVKFGKNPFNSFWEVFLKEVFTDAWTDRHTTDTMPWQQLAGLWPVELTTKLIWQKLKFVLRRVKNIVGRGENAGYQHFLMFQQCFKKSSFPRSINVGLCGKEPLERADIILVTGENAVYQKFLSPQCSQITPSEALLYRLIGMCLLLFSTWIQLPIMFTYPCFQRVFLSVLSKLLATFSQKWCWNICLLWERNESCCKDYQ